MVKIQHDATTFNWITFNCGFETSSDKLQNVSQSLNVSSLGTVCLTTVRCQIKSWVSSGTGTRQQSVEDAVNMSYSLDFQISQRCVVTLLKVRLKSLDMYIENFPTNQLVKKFWKSVPIWWSYYQTSRGILFWDTAYTVSQKHVTTFSRISSFTKIFGTLITKTIGYRQVLLVSHLTYFVQLFYLGKLSRPTYHEFSLKMLIFANATIQVLEY